MWPDPLDPPTPAVGRVAPAPRPAGTRSRVHPLVGSQVPGDPERLTLRVDPPRIAVRHSLTVGNRTPASEDRGAWLHAKQPDKCARATRHTPNRGWLSLRPPLTPLGYAVRAPAISWRVPATAPPVESARLAGQIRISTECRALSTEVRCPGRQAARPWRANEAVTRWIRANCRAPGRRSSDHTSCPSQSWSPRSASRLESRLRRSRWA